MQQTFRSILKAGKTLGQGLLHLVYPRVCWVCQQVRSIEEKAVCSECGKALLSDQRDACFRCASTVGPHLDTTEGCTACRRSKFHFDQAFRLAPYEGLLRDVVLRMKNSHGEGLAETFARFWAEQMATRLAALGPELVVPVPLHWWSHYRRGFNQSAILARALAARLRIPCETGRLQRCRRTREQKGLTGQDRWDNVKGAFRARTGANVENRTIILVDDVLTTGATASEAARPLKVLKPKRIVLAVMAHDH